MGQIVGFLTMNEIDIIEVSPNPMDGGGTPAAHGSLAIASDGSGMFFKFGENNADWSHINTFKPLLAWVDSESSKNNSNYETKVTLSALNLPLGNYLLTASFEIRGTLTASLGARVTLDSVSVKSTVFSLVDTLLNSSHQMKVPFENISGSHDFDLDFRLNSGLLATVYMSNAVLILEQVE